MAVALACCRTPPHGARVAHVRLVRVVRFRSTPIAVDSGSKGGTWSGPDDHSSGFSFAWSEGALVLLATVLDDEHFHTGGSGYNFVWDGDAMQMLFTDAERSEVVSLINVARYDDGTVHVQYEQLPDGSDGAPPDPAITATVERDEARHTTTYEVSVPSVLLGHAALSEVRTRAHEPTSHRAVPL